MSKRPTVVHISPFTYRIDWSANAICRVSYDEQTQLMGYQDEKALVIIVDGRLAEDQCRDTLLHEILHAAFDLAASPLDADTEERVVSALSPILLGVLRANPGGVDYLRSVDDPGGAASDPAPGPVADHRQ